MIFVILFRINQNKNPLIFNGFYYVMDKMPYAGISPL